MGIAQSEDEVSDRDLPELAPIDIQDYQRKGINTSKAVAQDDEPDLGKTLSPLGSTSSLQDLMESSSSTQPVQELAKTTWIERERQKKSVIVIEPNIAEATNLESKSDSKSNGGKRSSKKMDSVTSASKTNETSANAATLEDNQEAQNTQ